MNKVGLYIPCFNGERTIAACLEAVLSQDYPLDEIVVVDDGSKDNTAQIVQRYPVKLVRHDANQGLASARNTAIKVMTSEFVASVDADCLVDHNWLSELMGVFKEPGVSGAGGRLVEADVSGVCDQWRCVHMPQYWPFDAGDVPFLFGSNTVFRRAVLEEVGLYDPQFLSNYEDVDISHRILKAGKRLFYQARAKGRHDKQDNIFSLFNAFWKWQQQYYLEKGFYATQDSFLLKMQDNAGLVNRYWEEDDAEGRPELLYLNVLLLAHHSLCDLAMFSLKAGAFDGIKESPLLSSWLALVDLDFCYHFSKDLPKMPSLLRAKELPALNFWAYVFVLHQRMRLRIQDGFFGQLFFKHLHVAVYGFSDQLLLNKLSSLLEANIAWEGLNQKEHPYFSREFLNVVDMTEKLMERLNMFSSQGMAVLKHGQAVLEDDLKQKGFL